MSKINVLSNCKTNGYKLNLLLFVWIVIVLGCSPKKDNKVTFPLVISTWNSGIAVNKVAFGVMSEGKKSIDAVEEGAKSIESTVNCCVGIGGNPDRDGYVTLDACIMDHEYNCGAVAFLERIEHPISVARKIMETTPHVMLVGAGAQKFAVENGFGLTDGKLSSAADKTYQEWLVKSEYQPTLNIEQTQGSSDRKTDPPKRLPNGDFNHDTMGLLAIDADGDLAGACTTSGMGFKMRGRVGDSPIIGAGLYVDNEIGAATSSGQGEEVIRINGTHLVVELMRQGNSPEQACKLAIERLVRINPEKAKTFQVGFIAVNKKGEYGAYAMVPGFNYSVTSADIPDGKVIDAASHFAK